MALTLIELHRVCKPQTKLIFVVGHESMVLGVPFFNADIISALSVRTGLYNVVLRQNRVFKNKFGKMIREDLLHLENSNRSICQEELHTIARQVAYNALQSGLFIVSKKNKASLVSAIEAISTTDGTAIYKNEDISKYTLTENHDVSVGT